MFSKRNRLSLTTRYQTLKENGRWLNSVLFNILYSFKLGNKKPQIAVSAGNRVSTSAVERHRIRRLITEAVRPYLSVFPPNLTMVVFARKEISDKNFWEIKEEIAKAISIISTKFQIV